MLFKTELREMTDGLRMWSNNYISPEEMRWPDWPRAARHMAQHETAQRVKDLCGCRGIKEVTDGRGGADLGRERWHLSGPAEILLVATKGKLMIKTRIWVGITAHSYRLNSYSSDWRSKACGHSRFW